MQCMHIVLFRRKINFFYWNGCKYPLYKKGREYISEICQIYCSDGRTEKRKLYGVFSIVPFFGRGTYVLLECVDHEVDSICQVSYMDEEQREEFLEEFEQEREKSLVAFCVMGGIFSEGIDLTDDKLIGAVIAGTGLPQVCTEREILKQYFNAADMDGFDYAYLYPGMNKVLQSAGRVIRTESDRGVILLLDDRFRAMRYREVFPREWQQYQLGSVKNLEQEIRTFWESP